LLGLLSAEGVSGRLETVGVVRLERGLLGLNSGLLLEELLLAELIISCGLNLLEASREAILESGLLRLSILTVQVPGALRLLLERVSKPIYCRLLLVALIPAGLLNLSWCRGIIKQRNGIFLFQLTGASLGFFPAESIAFFTSGSFRSSSPAFILFLRAASSASLRLSSFACSI